MDPTSNKPTRKTSGGPTPTMALIIGFCCLVCGVVNIWHSQHSATATHRDNAIVTKHLQTFQQDVTEARKDISFDHTYKTSQNNDYGEPHLATLNCDRWGGPSQEFAQEMVYWKVIPADTKYRSPFQVKKGQQKKYMTFEPDGGGWNNIRMAMETVLGLGMYFCS